MIGQLVAICRKGDGRCPERQSGRHDDEAHRLVEDDGLERAETKRADEQRQSKLGASETDQPAERADRRAADERESLPWSLRS